MEVITISSDAFKRIQTQLDRIESIVERTMGIHEEVDENLEMTNNELMDILKVSASTLYRWRKDGCVKHRYLDSREIRYPFKSVYNAIRLGAIIVHGRNKDEILDALDRFKDRVIVSSIVRNNGMEYD